MPARQDRIVRWVASLLIAALVPAIWWITTSPAQPEVAGLYSFRRAAFNLAVTAAGLAVVYLLLGGKSTRHKVLVLLSQATAIGLCWLILEIPALLFGFDYQRIFGAATDATELDLSSSRTNKPDPVLIHIHWPNSSFSGEVAGNLAHLGIPRPPRHKADVRYDRNGFRNDREFDLADIVVIGDSFVEAAIVARDRTLVGQLESRLKLPTANLGQIAYGFRQELEVLRRFAPPLSPKLVIWVVFGGNDFRDIEFYERQVKRFSAPQIPVTLEQRLGLRNALVAGGKVLVDALRSVSGEPTQSALNHSGLFTRSDGVTERVYFDPPEESPTPYQWEVAMGTLNEARRLSLGIGAEFVVVYVPRKFRVYRDHLRISNEHGIATWAVNDLQGELGKWCFHNDIPFVDTTARMGQVVARGEHPYFVDDVHWNEVGHATAAEAVIALLESRRLYPFGPRRSRVP